MRARLTLRRPAGRERLVCKLSGPGWWRYRRFARCDGCSPMREDGGGDEPDQVVGLRQTRAVPTSDPLLVLREGGECPRCPVPGTRRVHLPRMHAGSGGELLPDAESAALKQPQRRPETGPGRLCGMGG